MSKSKKNVVDPVAIIEQYGADTARWFVLSDSPPERDVEWTASGAEATHKHLARVWRLANEIAEADGQGSGDDDLIRAMHHAINDVTLGIESFGFNAAVARLYAFSGRAREVEGRGGDTARGHENPRAMMSPMVPHLAEDIWALLGGEGLIANAPWPVADPAMLVSDSVTLPIQINGKRRSEITVAKDMSTSELEKCALADQAVIKALDGGEPRKLIVVPGRIINVVI